MTKVSVIRLGDRSFLSVSGGFSIAIDRIKSFDLNASDGDCDNCVKVETTGKDAFYFNYDDADALRAFLDRHTILE